MKSILTLAVLVSCSVCYGQYVYPYPYLNKQEFLEQQRFDNALRLRQMELAERQFKRRSPVLDRAEQALRVRVLKAQEENIRESTRNGFYANPFVENNPFNN